MIVDWAQQLAAIAQSGLTYSLSPYDTERYEQIRGIAAGMLAAAAEGDPATFVRLLSHDRGYATPKVDVRGAAFDDDGRLLLVREREDGLWTLPGGWADVGQSARESVEREVFEESGFKVVARKLAAVLDRNKHGHPPFPFHTYKLFFLCDITGGEATPSYETPEVAFFHPRELPPLSLTRVMPSQIELLERHRADPLLPTVFD
ncbi:MAG: NUDIX hydrolase [Bryobacteraceae bacterium]|nr:NUDIX hydrolase [Bryobacteraceae bacterium]